MTSPGSPAVRPVGRRLLLGTLVALVPLGLVLATGPHPRWIVMWSLAVSIYAALKWIALMTAGKSAPLWRRMAFLMLWPGMDADAFLDTTRTVPRPRAGKFLFATGEFVLGIALVVVASRVIPHDRFFGGWIGIVGLAFVLHFGSFHLLALMWQAAGIDAEPIMNNPPAARSVNEFWGRRWNLAFRDMAHEHIFRPMAPRYGVRAASLAVFVASGLVHDVTISISGAGYGLPTLYFLLQAAAALFERRRWWRNVTARRPLLGWFYTAGVVLLPIGLLFHRAFIERIVASTIEGVVGFFAGSGG